MQLPVQGAGMDARGWGYAPDLTVAFATTHLNKWLSVFEEIHSTFLSHAKKLIQKVLSP